MLLGQKKSTILIFSLKENSKLKFAETNIKPHSSQKMNRFYLNVVVVVVCLTSFCDAFAFTSLDIDNHPCKPENLKVSFVNSSICSPHQGFNRNIYFLLYFSTEMTLSHNWWPIPRV
jgi:hypothetical protein